MSLQSYAVEPSQSMSFACDCDHIHWGMDRNYEDLVDQDLQTFCLPFHSTCGNQATCDDCVQTNKEA